MLLLFLLSCVSTQKLHEKGEYDKAYYAAIVDLKKNPSNADVLKILRAALQGSARKAYNNLKLADNYVPGDNDVSIWRFL